MILDFSPSTKEKGSIYDFLIVFVEFKFDNLLIFAPGLRF